MMARVKREWLYPILENKQSLLTSHELREIVPHKTYYRSTDCIKMDVCCRYIWMVKGVQVRVCTLAYASCCPLMDGSSGELWRVCMTTLCQTDCCGVHECRWSNVKTRLLCWVRDLLDVPSHRWWVNLVNDQGQALSLKITFIIQWSEDWAVLVSIVKLYVQTCCGCIDYLLPLSTPC